jgi:hypothetical protein
MLTEFAVHCRSTLLENRLVVTLRNMLRGNHDHFHIISLKAIAELAKYGTFTVWNYPLSIQTVADDVRDHLLEFNVVKPMLELLLHSKERCATLNAAVELAKHGTVYPSTESSLQILINNHRENTSQVIPSIHHSCSGNSFAKLQ